MLDWKILELIANQEQLISVTYSLSESDDENTVETQGKHVFCEGTVNKPLSAIVESDILQWIEKDTTKDDLNPIKLNLLSQLEALKTNKKVDLPWLANTFTVE